MGGSEIRQPPVEPCLKRPRRVQKQSVRLLDYGVGHVQAVTTVEGCNVL